jgi:uncharacterized protein YndB with AHSA1/START domain
MNNKKTKLTVQCVVNAPVAQVWKYWSTPEDIKVWNSASPDWHTPHSENDLRPGGKFSSRMEAKDGSFGFDFWGTYDEVRAHEYIGYTLGDGRTVAIQFRADGGITEIIETFEAESVNPLELQQGGWQAILNNFKSYAESKQ